MRELYHEIVSSLRNNKLRTALTGFAVSWGIFLLIALLGAGNGLMNSFMGNISEYISQSITVHSWQTAKPYAGYKANRRIQLDQQDIHYTNGKEWDGIIENVIVPSSDRTEADCPYFGKCGGCCFRLPWDGNQSLCCRAVRKKGIS